jgi:predicted phosphodiesterase
MKFQYLSDLHLEHGNKVVIDSCAEYLILAGDIGDPNNDYFSFFEKISPKFKLIFVIAGNHEYYARKRSMSETEKLIAEILGKFKNIIYLQNNVYHFPDSNISVFGSTMWTEIDEFEEQDIRYTLSDFRCIPNFSIDHYNRLHKTSLSCLECCLKENETRRWVVILHHVPQFRLIDPKYRHMSINSAFASNIPILDDENVIAVVYGHTHTPSVQGKYYCNPLGYPMENKKHNLQATFEIQE